MELITQILAICGAISVVGGAVAVLSGWYKSWKAPKEKQDNRIPGYVDVNYVYKNLGGTAKPVQKPNSTQTTTAKPVDESWKGDKRYYLENTRVGAWQKAMNIGFDTKVLSEDNKFGVGSQDFAKKHILWSGQTHNCITAIRWLRRTLRDVYGFTKLSYNEGWTDYLGKCVEVFQRNRGLTPDKKVGLITTYWLLSGIVK